MFSFLNRKEVFNHLLGEWPFGYPLLFFNFLVALSFSYFLPFYIMFQIDILNSFLLPIISYKDLILFFLYDLAFPFYYYVSKKLFVLLFVTRKKIIYTKNFPKIKEKTDSRYHNESQHYIWNFSVKQICLYR